MKFQPMSFALHIVALSALFLVLAPSSPSAVTVSLVPADTTTDVGTEVTHRVVTDAFADLKAYELIFWYDPAVLQLADVAAGDVLTSATGGYVDFERVEYDVPQDSVWYDASVLDGSTSGPGILAFFHFNVIGEGTGEIECRLIDFRNSSNVQTLPDCVAGRVHGVGPVPASSGTWGRLKTLYR